MFSVYVFLCVHVCVHVCVPCVCVRVCVCPVFPVSECVYVCVSSGPNKEKYIW